MPSEFKLILRDTAGTKFAEVTDMLSLAYSKRLYRPGLLSFTLPGNHAAIPQMANNAQVEVWRRNISAGLAWYCDFYGLYRAQDWNTDQADVFTATCPGQLAILGWRIIGYAAGVANRTTFSAAKAETIMKTLVKYNATSSGDASAGNTAGGFRARAASLSGFTITIEADGAHGNTLNWNCMGDNLLANMEKLAAVAGGDFDLIKTGATTWDFRWYTGQRGVDRSASVVFALGYGNMAAPHYQFDRTAEQTAAIVAGGGDGVARTFVARTGADYAAANDIELFVDARNDGVDTTAMNAHGDQKLYLARARQTFGFDIRQTDACRYGIHYCLAGALGDLVKARYRTISVTEKIMGVSVSWKDKLETIGLEFQSV